MSKSASRPLLPVEETIRARTQMNCEFRFYAFDSGHTAGVQSPLTPITTSHSRFWRGIRGTGKLFHISCGCGNTYRPEKTKWSPNRFSRDVVDYPFNVDWYMRERNTVANVKEFVGEFH